MPARVRKVCMVQFFAWIGWFLFLFYVTTYLGDFYQDEFRYASNFCPCSILTISSTRLDKIRQYGYDNICFCRPSLECRVSLFCRSCLRAHRIRGIETRRRRGSLPSIYVSVKTLLQANTPSILANYSTPWTASSPILRDSHVDIIHSGPPCVLSPNCLARNFVGRTQWAPLVLISEEIAKQRASRKGCCSPADSRLQESHCMESSSADFDGEERGRVGVQSSARTILSVYNLSVATPRIVAAIGSSALFWIMGFWGLVGENAIEWVIIVGSIAASIITFFAINIKNNSM